MSTWKLNFLALVGVICIGANSALAQAITLFPDEVPNGIAAVQRHLTGHDTIDVQPGLDLSGVLPTRDGDGVQRAALLAGDGTLGTIRFRAIARSVETHLALEDALLIDVDHVSVRPMVEGEAMILVSKDPIVYRDAAGNEIRGLILADTDATVDFNDFVVLVKVFGSELNEADFDLRADLNADDRVDFSDFVILSSDFGKVAVDAPASGRVNKPATSAGVNSSARLGFRLDERPDRQLEVSLGLEKVSSLQGWGVTMKYDPDKYEFVEAKLPSRNFLEARGGTAPLFLIHREAKDRITLAGAIGRGPSVSGGGTIVGLMFRPRGEATDAQFEVTKATLFDSRMQTNVLQSSDIAVTDNVTSAFAWLKEVFKPLRSGTGLLSR